MANIERREDNLVVKLLIYKILIFKDFFGLKKVIKK